MFKRQLLWFLTFAVSLRIASPQAPSSAAPSAACVPQAYAANLLPIFQPFASLPDAAYEKFDESKPSVASVTILVTVGPDGRVAGTEVLGGPEFLRETATNAVRHYRYQPVIRFGERVCAQTSANVTFQTPGKLLVPEDVASMRVAFQRLQAIQKQWTRTPEQVLLDMQQEFDVPGGLRRTLALPRLAKAALAAGALDKAVAYAQEGLSPNGGMNAQCTFDCNMVLGQVALRNGNVAEAAQYLIASGKTAGSPALSSFGPNMSLAKELLEKGQRDVVLEFFTLCKGFWTAKSLDGWSETVRNGGVPNFGANLLY